MTALKMKSSMTFGPAPASERFVMDDEAPVSTPEVNLPTGWRVDPEFLGAEQAPTERFKLDPTFSEALDTAKRFKVQTFQDAGLADFTGEEDVPERPLSRAEEMTKDLPFMQIGRTPVAPPTPSFTGTPEAAVPASTVSRETFPGVAAPIPDRGFVGGLAEKARRGVESADIEREMYEVAQGFRDYDEVKGREDEFNARVGRDPIEGHFWLTKAAFGAAGMSGPMAEGSMQGAAAALAALAAGQLGPQVGIPEEVITVPLAFKIGAGQYWYRQGVGSFYSAMRKQGVGHEIAAAVALGMGLPYALIEGMQVGQLVPGANKITNAAIDGALRTALGKIAAKPGGALALKAGATGVKYATTIGKETSEEVLQEITAIAAEEGSKMLENLFNDKDLAHTAFGKAAGRLLETAKQTVGPMALLAGPGTIIDAAGSGDFAPPPEQEAAAPIEPTPEPAAPAVEVTPEAGFDQVADEDIKAALAGEEEITEPTEAKQPWKMTLKEVTESKVGRGFGKFGMDSEEHRLLVKQALADGETVPAEVLAEYPDLATEIAEIPPVSTEIAPQEPLSPVEPTPTTPEQEEGLKAVSEEAVPEPAAEDVKVEQDTPTEKTISADIPATEKDQITPKDQKKFLLSEIDTALEGVTIDDVEQEDVPPNVDYNIFGDQNEGRARIAKEEAVAEAVYTANKEKYGTVTIEVPGDGVLTVLNTKRSLDEFKKRAQKFPTAPSKPSAPKMAVKAKPTGQRLGGEGIEYYNPFVVHKQGPYIEGVDSKGKPFNLYGNGFFTDGHYAVKAPKPPAKITLLSRKPDIKQVIPKETVPAKIIAQFNVGVNALAPVNVHVIDENGVNIFVDAKFIDAILGQHPTATVHSSGSPESALVFKKGKTVVGMAMPIRHESDFPQTNYTERVNSETNEFYTEEELAQRKPVPEVESAVEPWQMMREEFENIHGKPTGTTTVTGGFTPHKEAVATALNRGDAVPAEVLADYPDLAPTPETAVPELDTTKLPRGWEQRSIVRLDAEGNEIFGPAVGVDVAKTQEEISFKTKPKGDAIKELRRAGYKTDDGLVWTNKLHDTEPTPPAKKPAVPLPPKPVQQFIDKKVAQLGSRQAAVEFYTTGSAVDQYGRAAAARLYPDEPLPEAEVKVTTVVETEPTTVKEPWEMTRTEFSQSPNTTSRLSESIAVGGDKPNLILANMYKGKIFKGRKGEGHASISDRTKTPFRKTITGFVDKNTGEFIFQNPEYSHQLLVEQALADGKPVPPEVLADYPDLVKKQAVPKKPAKPPAEAGERGSFTLGPKPEEKLHTFGNEQEEAYEAARGIGDPPVFDKIAEGATDFWHKLSRTFEHLPNTKEFAQLQFDLLKLAKQKGLASDKVLRSIKSIVDGLSIPEYDLFNKKVLVDDLLETTRDGLAVPFGFDKESLETNQAEIDKLLKDNPAVTEAIEKRKEVWKRLKGDYVTAMRSIRFNVEDQLKRKNYFRHQVLDYARTRALSGVGKKLRTPAGRGFQKKREGSIMDINTDYLQAEHEVMAQMVYDMEIARTIKSVDKNYNIIDTLKAQALQMNNERFMDSLRATAKAMGATDELDIEEVANKMRKQLNVKQAIGLDKLRKLAVNDELPAGPNNKYLDLIEALASGNDLTNKQYSRLFEYMSWLLKEHSGEPGSGAAALVFKGIQKKRETIKQTLGKKFVEWKHIIPDGYEDWQPREGNVFFMADTIPAQLAQMLAEGALKEAGITKEHISRMMVVGAERSQMVVKSEVAATLDELMKDRPGLTNYRKMIRGWKIWQLISPRRFFKYNLRNITGDAEAMFIGNHKAFTKLPQAVEELFRAYRTDKPLTGSVKQWLDRGGTLSTLQAQEMGELNRLKPFVEFYQNKDINIFKKAWVKYWTTARVSTDFRESILRYAAFLSSLEDQNQHGKVTNYGASRPGEIDGLADKFDKAYWISNDLLGAYDRVSVIGQTLRQTVFPFWSWKEVNTKRFVQLMRNAAMDDRVAEAVGRKLMGTAARAPFTAMRMGRFAIKAYAFTALLQVWNQLMFGDDEEELSKSVREKPHINLGRDSEGNIRYFSRLGAVGDLLEWGNFDQIPQYTQAWKKGQMNVAEIGKEMALAPFNVLAQMWEPGSKTLAELATRRSLFPDVFKPGTVRDRMLHLARGIGLDNEYRLLPSVPTRGYRQSLSGLFYYKTDAQEAAYWNLADELRRYKKKQGKEYEGFILTPKGNALYNYKLALRYGDKKAAKEHLDAYAEFYADFDEGTFALDKYKRGLKTSLSRMHPFSGMDADEINDFKDNWLDPEDEKMILNAMKFYEELMEEAVRKE